MKHLAPVFSVNQVISLAHKNKKYQNLIVHTAKQFGGDFSDWVAAAAFLNRLDDEDEVVDEMNCNLTIDPE